MLSTKLHFKAFKYKHGMERMQRMQLHLATSWMLPSDCTKPGFEFECLKHLGFFKENKKARITSGLSRILAFAKHFFGEMGERSLPFSSKFSCLKRIHRVQLTWHFF